MCNAQSGDPNDGVYNALVQQAQSLLAASPDQSLTLSQQIVKLNPARWEGYDLTGLALTSLRRYDEATVQFGQALAHAPATAQPGISAHLKHCVQAETGPAPATEVAPSPQYPQPQPAPQAQPATSQDAGGPSMEVTAKYILDTLNNSTRNRLDGTTTVQVGWHEYSSTRTEEVSGVEFPEPCILKWVDQFLIEDSSSTGRYTYQVDLADIDLSKSLLPGDVYPTIYMITGKSQIVETGGPTTYKEDVRRRPKKEGPALDAWREAQIGLLESAKSCTPGNKDCTTKQYEQYSIGMAFAQGDVRGALRHLATQCGASSGSIF